MTLVLTIILVITSALLIVLVLLHKAVGHEFTSHWGIARNDNTF